ncbi:MAG: efflux RND transporter periplasmic adaptor subunit [Bacillus sp. (in: firmicutes)]
MKKKIWIAAGIISSIMLMVGITIYRQAEEKSLQVKVSQARIEKISENLMIPGTVKLDQQQQVYYSPDKGKIVSYHVKEGQQVKPGTVLVKYSQPQLELELEQSQLAIDSAYLKLNQTKDQIASLQDKEDDLAKTVGRKKAKEQLEQERTTLETERKMADIELKQAVLQKQGIEQNMKDLTVDSQITGTVLSINKQAGEGSTQTVSEPIIMIGQLGSLTVTGDITEYDSVKVKKGQHVTIRSDAIADREWTGEISTISLLPKETALDASNDGAAAQYPISVVVKDPTGLLRPGFQLIMEIATQEKEALTIPMEAVVSNGDRQYIFVVEENMAKKTEVETGITSGDKIEIQSGIKKDEQVIVKPPETLKDGMEVIVE